MPCIIVRHGAYGEYDRIHQAFGHLVPVVWDRRRARIRPRADADTTPSASQPNVRQKPPPSWTALGFVVVDRPPHRPRIIVRHGAYEEYDRLHKAFGRLVPVVWARRRARDRPRADADTTPSASQPNVRQKPPPSWTALGFIVVDRPPRQRRPGQS